MTPRCAGAIPTGSIGLDLALGIGGYPRGRIIEVYGPESSGKTTLTLHAIAERPEGRGASRRSSTPSTRSTPTYARKLGVKTDELLVSQPDFGEQALEIADMLVRSGAVDIIVIDSVAALVPKGGNRGRHGRQPRRHAGASHVAGASQAHGDGRQVSTACSSSSTRSA